tara:strand:+ start:211 stop:429 length:219 start_codon:yes stop_codon:yes gene_type:complete
MKLPNPDYQSYHHYYLDLKFLNLHLLRVYYQSHHQSLHLNHWEHHRDHHQYMKFLMLMKKNHSNLYLHLHLR